MTKNSAPKKNNKKQQQQRSASTPKPKDRKKTKKSKELLTDEQKETLKQTGLAIRNHGGIPVIFVHNKLEKVPEPLFYALISDCEVTPKNSKCTIEFPINSGVYWNSVSSVCSMMWLCDSIIKDDPVVRGKEKIPGQYKANGNENLWYYHYSGRWRKLQERPKTGEFCKYDLFTSAVMQGDEEIDLSNLSDDQPLSLKKITSLPKTKKHTRSKLLSVADLIKYGILNPDIDYKKNKMFKKSGNAYLHLPSDYEPFPENVTATATKISKSRKRKISELDEEEEEEEEDTETVADDNNSEEEDTADTSRHNLVRKHQTRQREKQGKVKTNNRAQQQQPPLVIEDYSFAGYFDYLRDRIVEHAKLWSGPLANDTLFRRYNAGQMLGICFEGRYPTESEIHENATYVVGAFGPGNLQLPDDTKKQLVISIEESRTLMLNMLQELEELHITNFWPED